MHGHFMGEAMPLAALMLLGTGLAMSFGHCLGMCGPLVGSLAAGAREDANPRQPWPVHVLSTGMEISPFPEMSDRGRSCPLKWR